MKELEYNDIDNWFDNTDIGLLDEDVTEEVNGYRVISTSWTSCHSEKVDVTITFVDFDVTIETTGYKNISYDKWKDTDFYVWKYA